eukprot:8310884-Pyramimonas_sp.AAC.1
MRPSGAPRGLGGPRTPPGSFRRPPEALGAFGGRSSSREALAGARPNPSRRPPEALGGTRASFGRPQRPSEAPGGPGSSHGGCRQ